LASLTVGQLVFDADPPFLTLDAADEKNREGNSIPLRADLAADLRQWLADKAAGHQGGQRDQDEAAGLAGHVLRLPAAAAKLAHDTPVFTVPAALVKILDRDLKAAEIPKRDERGRTVDVHAMRHTFGTLLSKGGVLPRTAQAAMRHSTINLTMNTYTDPKLLDVAGAVEALPALPLGAGPQRERIAAKATGTDDFGASQFAPKFAPTSGNLCILGSILDKVTSNRGEAVEAGAVAASAYPVKRNEPLSMLDNGSVKWAMRDSDPRLPRCKRVKVP
jgi:hypothetical protein